LMLHLSSQWQERWLKNRKVEQERSCLCTVDRPFWATDWLFATIINVRRATNQRKRTSYHL
jgi:hypothetical protein